MKLLTLSKNDSVIECGCGVGDFLPYLTSSCDFVCGFDISFSSVKLGKATGASLVVSDADNIPFKSGTFDAAVVKGALHHFPDVLFALTEIRRILRKGGVLVLAEPIGDTRLNHSLRSRLSSKDERWFQTQQLLEYLNRSGFQIISVDPKTYFAVGLAILLRRILSKIRGPNSLISSVVKLIIASEKIFLIPFLQKHSLAIMVSCMNP